MTPVEWTEYRRRLELRDARRRDVRTAVGFTDAPSRAARRRANTRRPPRHTPAEPAEPAGTLDRS